MDTTKGSVTILLDRWAQGEPDAVEELFAVVYPELQRLASVALRQEWSPVSWQRTTLVNEALLRLLAENEPTWESRAAFFAHAVTTIRRILIEHSRRRGAQKRWGQAERVALTEGVAARPNPVDEALDVSIALDRLRVTDPRGAQIVELRFFLGLKNQEIASMLDISLRSVEREFEFARACLRRLLSNL